MITAETGIRSTLVIGIGPQGMAVLSWLHENRNHPTLRLLAIGSNRPVSDFPVQNCIILNTALDSRKLPWIENCTERTVLTRPAARSAWISQLERPNSKSAQILIQFLGEAYDLSPSHRPRVIVVVDLGDPVGSGLLIDLAVCPYLLKPSHRGAPDVWLYGVIPDFNEATASMNACAALVELERFIVEAQTTYGYPLGYDQVTNPRLRNARIKYPPFTRLYLYDAERNPIYTIAQTIGAWVGQSAATMLTTATINTDKEIAKAVENGRILCGTTRCAEISLPVNLLQQRWTYGLIREWLPPTNHMGVDGKTLVHSFLKNQASYPLKALHNTEFAPDFWDQPLWQNAQFANLLPCGNLQDRDYMTFAYKCLHSFEDADNAIQSTMNTLEKLVSLTVHEDTQSLYKLLDGALNKHQAALVDFVDVIVNLKQGAIVALEATEERLQSYQTEWGHRRNIVRRELKLLQQIASKSTGTLGWWGYRRKLHDSYKVAVRQIKEARRTLTKLLNALASHTYLLKWCDALDNIKQKLSGLSTFWINVEEKIPQTSLPNFDPSVEKWIVSRRKLLHRRINSLSLVWTNDLQPTINDQHLNVDDVESSYQQLLHIARGVFQDIGNNVAVLRYLREIYPNPSPLSDMLVESASDSKLQLNAYLGNEAIENAWLLGAAQDPDDHRWFDNLAGSIRQKHDFSADNASFLQTQIIDDSSRMTLLYVTDLIDLRQGVASISKLMQKYLEQPRECLHVFWGEAIAARFQIQLTHRVTAILYDPERILHFWKASGSGALLYHVTIGYYIEYERGEKWVLSAKHDRVDAAARFVAQYDLEAPIAYSVNQAIGVRWNEYVSQVDPTSISEPRLNRLWQRTLQPTLPAKNAEQAQTLIRESAALLHLAEQMAGEQSHTDEDERALARIGVHLLQENAQKNYDLIRTLTR